MTMRLLSSLLLLPILFASVGMADSAKVVRIRGSATMLAPKAKRAQDIKLNDIIQEDASILTQTKSFVILEFSDKSRISIGPDSKIIVTKTRSSDPGIISLLKGKIRSQVKPNGTEDTKYFIRTRTAAMAVRGTDFQSSFNPENKATSLVTFKGKVAMVRVDVPVHELASPQNSQSVQAGTEIERESSGAPVVDELPTISKQVDLNEVFKNSKAVEVQGGQYAGALGGLKSVTEPVVINPAQAQILYHNEEMAPIAEGEKLEVVDFSSIKHQGNPDSFYDEKSDQFRPRAGGFIDPDTALYIPPREDSKLDPATNIYIASNVGYIDRSTGDYIAPKGLNLDPNLGFVAKNPEDQILLAQAGQLNQTMAKDVLLKELEQETPIIRPNKRERIAREALWLSFGPSGDKYDVTSDTRHSGGGLSRDSDGAFSFQLGHDHVAIEGWQFLTRIGYRNVELHEDQNAQKSGDSLWNFGVGLRHAFSPRLALSSLISLEQRFLYAHPNSNGTITNEWERFTLPTIEILLESEFFRTRRFALLAEGGLIVTLPKSKADIDVDPALGFILRAGVEWWVSGHMTIGANFYTKQIKHQLESGDFSNENESRMNGIELRTHYLF